MFSRTTIELSTSIPIPRRSPAIEIIFIVIPRRYMHKSVIITEIGIDKPTMSVDFIERRKMNKIAIARSAPWTTDMTTSFIVCEMMSVVFDVSRISMSEGISVLSFLSVFLTFSAACTEFFPDCFWMFIITHGFPSR